MCIGCRETDDQSVLVRLTTEFRGAAALVRRQPVGQRGQGSGRGAYVHDRQKCLQAASGKGVFGRSLRIPRQFEAELLFKTSNSAAVSTGM